ncbi:MAG: hypothetical protein JXR77_18150, partial [Lentisphaeria bacterium]|nr:hypothetical protein [Lentisphaeria bacterium]
MSGKRGRAHGCPPGCFSDAVVDAAEGGGIEGGRFGRDAALWLSGQGCFKIPTPPPGLSRWSADRRVGRGRGRA